MSITLHNLICCPQILLVLPRSLVLSYWRIHLLCWALPLVAMLRRIPSAENLRHAMNISLKTTAERIKRTANKFPTSLEQIRSNGLKRGQLFTMKIYGTWTLYGTCFFLAAYFTLIVITLLLIAALILFSPLLAYFLCKTLLGKGTHAKFGKDVCERYENNLIASSISSSNFIVYNDWINVTHRDDTFHVHSVIINNMTCTSRRPKKTLVWIHGVGGTGTISFILSGIANKLADDFNIYCVDLPGFGRSTAPSSYKNATRNEIEEMMSCVIHEYIVRKGKESVHYFVLTSRISIVRIMMNVFSSTEYIY